MDLWYAPTSPFARKVRIAAHELGLANRIRLVEVDPWTDARLRALNPLAKVPTLVLESGEVLYESSVLCEYLDSLAPEPRLFPAVGPQRWRALLLQGLADGASTAAGRLFADERRPANHRAEAMLARFTQAIDAALHALEPQALRTDLPDHRRGLGRRPPGLSRLPLAGARLACPPPAPRRLVYTFPAGMWTAARYGMLPGSLVKSVWKRVVSGGSSSPV